jgi:hypothetical protein
MSLCAIIFNDDGSLSMFYRTRIMHITRNITIMLEHLCGDLEQESKEALATWVLVQIFTQSSFLCLYVLAYFSM